VSISVIGKRELKHVLEIAGEDDMAAAVCKAIGVESDQGAAGNCKNAKSGPCGE
jgi:hypothetical protein